MFRIPRSARIAALAASCLLVCLSVPAAGQASSSSCQASRAGSARVPDNFFGSVVGDPLWGTVNNDPFAPKMAVDPALPGQMDSMVASGVETMRVVFDWAAVQPYRTWDDVPPDEIDEFSSNGVDAVPTDFTALDSLVQEAAQRGLTLLPTVIDAPPWDGLARKSGNVVTMVKRSTYYANFFKVLIHRYGSHGTFWASTSPRLPITEWQVWNEPNVDPAFWNSPFLPGYTNLLAVAHKAIKSADPHAKVVLAGLANYSWGALRSIYKVHGARGLFDAVAVHPYTKCPSGVITILGKVRAVMNRYGDSRKPLIADEISWPSALGKTTHDSACGCMVTEKGQAQNIAQVLPLLAANRTRLGLSAVYYYTWVSIEHVGGLAFDYSGLFKWQNDGLVRKPAFYAFRHYAMALERCHAKARTATVCSKPY